MITKKRTEIMIETHDVWIVRRSCAPCATLCAQCEAESPMTRPEEAAHIAGVSTRAVYQWVEAGAVHFTETLDGGIFVCLASLPDPVA